MGTANSHVTVTASTRKGSGRTNQDRYIIGPNFAAVLDGASNFSEEQPEQDGGWYAETLAARLRELLTAQPDSSLPEIVERAIESVATEHDLRADTSPTSTVALARWDDEHVEIYVLGDSTVAIIDTDGSEDAYSDDRIASIGGGLRRAYQERLAAGSGFDEEHRRLLASLQAEQAKWRNREDGYWIAGTEPEAANHAMAGVCRRLDIARLILATDGAATGITRYRTLPSWGSVRANAVTDLLGGIEAVEETDAEGKQWPRSKRRDDKTLVVLHLD
jgi:serine/threonine protein phosphatase PrpC